MTKFRTIIFASAAFGAAGLCYFVSADRQEPSDPAFPTVQIDGGEYSYWPAGEFRIAGHVVDAPKTIQIGQAFEIMKFPVSQKDYRRCVASGSCNETVDDGRDEVAQTNVSYNDAVIFGDWISRSTGEIWRLPTDAEWLRAAGSEFLRAPDPGALSKSDPSQRWLANYQSQVRARGKTDGKLHALGSFGENPFGVADIGGNIWEWTSTCFQNTRLANGGESVEAVSEYCGLRAAQGKHRAFVNVFVRDARAGGCAVGLPPDFLGFRLVREIP